MAVVTTKSAQITALDATPKGVLHALDIAGTEHVATGTLEMASGDSATSQFRLTRIPSHARVLSIVLFWDAIASSGAIDVGLYRINDGAVYDADAYASAVALQTASTAGTEVAFEARNIDKINNKAWQDAGLTSDPGVLMDIVATLTADTGAAGTLSFRIKYATE